MYLRQRGLEEDLAQGDILLTDPLRDLLGEFHRHFLDSKYTAFIITTQTCDLVRRKSNPCSSRYVNLAVIRPLEDVLCDLLGCVCRAVMEDGRPVPGLFLHESRGDARALLSRIVNQNEQAQGLFYLETSADARIAVPSVALLQVSFAVHAHDHYGILQSARCGGLNDVFRARLGWLIGNLYSRVATADIAKTREAELLKELLPRRPSGAQQPVWARAAEVSNAQEAGEKLAGIQVRDLPSVLAQYAPEPAVETAIKRVQVVLGQVLTEVPAESLDRVARDLRRDPVFANVCRRPESLPEE